MDRDSSKFHLYFATAENDLPFSVSYSPVLQCGQPIPEYAKQLFDSEGRRPLHHTHTQTTNSLQETSAVFTSPAHLPEILSRRKPADMNSLSPREVAGILFGINCIAFFVMMLPDNIRLEVWGFFLFVAMLVYLPISNDRE